VWNLPLDHPVNLAYEAATADIGDYNVLDAYHEEAYGIESVNYNRDVEAFGLLSQLAEEFVSSGNAIKKYKSPTDMGINTAGAAITNDKVVCLAAVQEIERRKEWYEQLVQSTKTQVQTYQKAADKCLVLLHKAKEYCEGKGY